MIPTVHTYSSVLDSLMKLIVSLLIVFLVIVTIGAPPVIENVKEEPKKTDSTKDASDEVVRTPTNRWRGPTMDFLFLARQS